MFEEPPRALSGGWDGTRDADRSAGKRAWGWVALRDLGSKFGSPSTLGSLASNCKAKGGGGPVGGEVTGIGRGGRALGASSSHVPPPLVCTLTLEALRGESPTGPHLASRPGTQRPRAGRRESKHN